LFDSHYWKCASLLSFFAIACPIQEKSRFFSKFGKEYNDREIDFKTAKISKYEVFCQDFEKNSNG
jgi:hypothetical protein